MIRIFDNTGSGRCMQRLGFLKYIVPRCASYNTTNISTIGKNLINTITQKIKVPLNEDILNYLKNVRSYHINNKLITHEEFINIEIQDIYLSDVSLPSRTGRLPLTDWDKYPYFATSLGLLRKGTLSLLGKGQLLLHLIPQNEISAFKEYTDGLNPFKINDRQSLFFIFIFIQNDGDVLKLLYDKAIELGEFTDEKLGDSLADIYLTLANKARKIVRSGDDLVRIRHLIDASKVIESWKGKREKGRSARGNAIAIRVEPFVDLKLLNKENPLSYKYNFSSSGKMFFESYISSSDIQEFLYKSFFQVCNNSYNFNANRTNDKNKILDLVYKSYNILKSPLGYASIEDVVLLAGINAIIEQKIYFEIGEAISLLKKFQKEMPDIIRFNIDRMGNLTYLKFNANPIEKIK